MCGICGKLMFDRQANVSPALVKGMADAIRHRGPDDDGYYVRGQIGLGFRRLSIIDLNTGHQPISNEDGSVWVVFNGEIYNYQELREYLLSKGHVLKTKTDTEVIVHLYEELGERCVEKLRGMFAFAVWDERKKLLFLARDRVGIKPLYYFLSDSCLIFASEIKAILVDPEVKPEVVPGMIDRFLTFNYLPGQETLLRGVCKLPPGHSMVVREGKQTIRQYWDLSFSESEISLHQAESELLGLLEESVRLHMISDVPVGFLLSGGVDSTAMLGFAVGKTDRELSSFTIGFSEAGITDERPYAKLAAQKYGTKHHEMTIDSKDFADFLPRYVSHMEEPVCEPPAVALYYVSKLAKDFVKVLISGEGGDEAFAGYSNYRNMLWMERLKSISKPLNRALCSGVTTVGRALKSRKLLRYAPLCNIPLEQYYYSRTSGPFHFFNQHSASIYSSAFAHTVNKQQSLGVLVDLFQHTTGNNALSKMLYVDTKTWLPDDLLIKADKMTMANSIELRVPLLDHKLMEFAASLPVDFKVHGATTKYILKKTLQGRVPREILNRKKTGFPVPYEAWLRSDLSGWVHDILLDRETLARGYFQRTGVENLLSENAHFGVHSKEIFDLVVLELWHREFIGKAETSLHQAPLDAAAVS